MLPTSSSEGRPVGFTWTPLAFPCPVPVTADGLIVGEDGQPLPLEDRGLACGKPACWWIGAQLSCDEHTRLACGFMGVDYDDLEAEAKNAAA